MIVLDHLAVHFAQGYLFDDISLQINKKDRVGLVGKNGAGKSTLLKLVAGKMQPSEGAVHMPKDCTIGFLTQDIEIDTSREVFDYVYASNEQLIRIQQRIQQINEAITTRDDYESESYLNLLNELNDLNHEFNVLEGFQWSEKVSATLRGLGFSDDDFPKQLNTFSGGWQMRAELAKLLVNQPDVLLLDEPTNHLDIISISWLENYLKNFGGAVVVISHDRLFLDNVTKRTIEIAKGRALDFAFPYSKYKEVRAEEIERMAVAKKQQEKDIKHTEELINKFRAKKNKAAFAQTLIRKLEKTERIEVEDDRIRGLNLKFPLSTQPGKWVLQLDEVAKSYANKHLFSGINLTVGRGEKIALLGANGTGKSTLIKCITSEIEFDGKIEPGHNVSIAYFAQDEAEKLDKDKSVFDTVDEIATGDLRSNLRALLGAFLFQGEDVDKKVAVLSGGERTRLALCKMLLSPSNVLILDEPTNHLDIQSKAILKDALLQYEGTFIVVSHDREFLDGLTNRIWDIEDGGLKVHHYEVQEYLSYKLEKLGGDSKKEETTKNNVSSEEKEVKPQAIDKELKKQRNRLENQIKRNEQRIEELEAEIASWDEKLANLDYSNADEAEKTLAEYNGLKEKLEQEMMSWESNSEELQNLVS